jgi:2-polyprenyl-3-methyl-5-hydroxy-6-metoxy-1,4-benzoquinol methylase
VKMPSRARTDREATLEASEFLWEQGGLSEIHALVLQPILSALRGHSAQRVIDIGCGNGTFSSLLAGEGFQITGIDSSTSGIDIAKQNYPHVEFRHHDINESLPLSMHGKFDAVVSVEVIEHLFRPRELLRRSAEALSASGVVALTTPYHGYLKNLVIAVLGGFDRHVHPLRDYGHIKFFSVATLRQLIEEADFVVEDVKFAGRVWPLAKSMVVTAHLSREAVSTKSRPRPESTSDR